MTSLWPVAFSNCAPSSLMGAVIAPPAKTWSSAACTQAVGDSTNAKLSTAIATVSECFCIKILNRQFGLSIVSAETSA